MIQPNQVRSADEHELVPETITSLQQALAEANIPLQEWGKGSAKTIDHLFAEITKQETSLIITEAKQAFRQVSLISIDVFYNDERGTFRLKEDKQVFADGRERQRAFPESLGEKMKGDEAPETAALRGLAEEIGVTKPLNLEFIRQEESERTSPSYPGLMSIYNMYFFKAELAKEDFKPEGYTEIDEDRTNYFVWERVENR